MNQNDKLITDPAVAARYPAKYLGTFGMLWVTFLIVAIFTTVKTFSLGPIVLSVGILAYPFTYIFADIFTEVYGYRVSRRIVWVGFMCAVIASVLGYLYSLVPPSESFLSNDAFNLIFKTSPIIAFGAIAAFFTGELINSFILAKLKIYTQGRHMWIRLISSTFFGQFIDNTVFFSMAFLGAGFFTANELLPLVLSSALFCTIWETLALPLTYRVIAFVKRKEGLDTYDQGTNFNPFYLRQ